MTQDERDLLAVVRLLVDDPDSVEVQERTRGRGKTLEVRLPEEQMGAVIGRGGSTAEALREVLRARGDSFGESYDLKIRSA